MEYSFSSRHFLRPIFTLVSPLRSDLSLTWVNTDYKGAVGNSLTWAVADGGGEKKLQYLHENVESVS